MHVGDPRQGADAPHQFLGDAQVLGAIIADRAHIDLRRNAEIQDLRHHIGRLEIEYYFRKCDAQLPPHSFDVFRGRGVAFFQRHKDYAIVDTDRGAVAERVVIRTRWQADIIDDHIPLAVGNDLTDFFLDRLKVL